VFAALVDCRRPRSLLLGLEVVVAIDIVRTIAVTPTLLSLAVLVGLAVIRTFLSWTPVLPDVGHGSVRNGGDACHRDHPEASSCTLSRSRASLPHAARQSIGYHSFCALDMIDATTFEAISKAASRSLIW